MLRSTGWIILGLMALSAPAQAERRGWFLEELSRSPLPTARDTERRQLGMTFVNASDSVSGRLSALAGLGPVELQLDAGQNFFGLGGTQQGQSMKAAYGKEVTFFGIEASRYFVDERNYYGRVGLKAINFEPLRLWSWRAALQTGVVARASQPWSVDLDARLFIYFNHLSDYLFITMRLQRLYFLGVDSTHYFSVGGLLNFGKYLRSNPGESILISYGPEFAYSSSLGVLALRLPLRMWVDYISVDSSSTNLGYLTSFDPPAAQLQWTLLW